MAHAWCSYQVRTYWVGTEGGKTNTQTTGDKFLGKGLCRHPSWCGPGTICLFHRVIAHVAWQEFTLHTQLYFMLFFSFSAAANTKKLTQVQRMVCLN